MEPLGKHDEIVEAMLGQLHPRPVGDPSSWLVVADRIARRRRRILIGSLAVSVVIVMAIGVWLQGFDRGRSPAVAHVSERVRQGPSGIQWLTTEHLLRIGGESTTELNALVDALPVIRWPSQGDADRLIGQSKTPIHDEVPS